MSQTKTPLPDCVGRAGALRSFTSLCSYHLLWASIGLFRIMYCSFPINSQENNSVSHREIRSTLNGSKYIYDKIIPYIVFVMTIRVTKFALLAWELNSFVATPAPSSPRVISSSVLVTGQAGPGDDMMAAVTFVWCVGHWDSHPAIISWLLSV